LTTSSLRACDGDGATSGNLMAKDSESLSDVRPDRQCCRRNSMTSSRVVSVGSGDCVVAAAAVAVARELSAKSRDAAGAADAVASVDCAADCAAGWSSEKSRGAEGAGDALPVGAAGR